jgi:hypothetical protein
MADPLPLDYNEAEPVYISTALDVEQLDRDLFRSRNLSLPFLFRGVFGGQVISQALVAATNCVSPEFHLHVSVCVCPPAPHNTCSSRRISPDPVTACTLFRQRDRFGLALTRP